jgi:hypothetical protein
MEAVEASRMGGSGGPPMRDAHDPRRPAISSGKAADRIGFSRFYVAQRIQDGTYDGYGIAGPERTRWYVYADVVEALERGDEQSPAVRLVAPQETRRAITEAATLIDRLEVEIRSERESMDLVAETAEWALRVCPSDDDERIDGRIRRAYTCTTNAHRSRRQIDHLIVELQASLARLSGTTGD